MQTAGVRRAVGAVLIALVVGGVSLVPTPPAAATPPFAAQSFNPRTSALHPPGSVHFLGDQFDGIDQLAHLTSVATSDADRALYVICPPGGAPVAPAPVPPDGCTLIGSDTVGARPPGILFPPVDEAYELAWDIPSTFDVATVGTRDVGVYSCTTVPTGAEPGGNCLFEVEPGVALDDSGTAEALPAGELTSWCIDTNADNVCNTLATPFGHGGAVPNLIGVFATAEYLVFARVSVDVTAPRLCIDTTANASLDIGACVSHAAELVAPAAPAFSTVRFDLDPTEAPPNSQMYWGLNESDVDPEGTLCDGAAETCILDAHYVASVPRIVAGTFVTDDEGPGLAFVDDGPTHCQDADRRKDTTTVTGGVGQVLACLFDQFADPDGDGNQDPDWALTDEPVTFELSAPGATFGPLPPDEHGVVVAGACPGDPANTHDHDGDGRFEHCHLTAATTGFVYGANWVTDRPGSVVVTVCRDPELTLPGDPDHGCLRARAAETAATSQGVIAGFDHLHLRLTSDVAAAPSCHRGPRSVAAPATTIVDLTGCARDRFGNATQVELGILFRLNTAGVDPAGQDPARFVGPPEELITEGDVRALVTASPDAAGHLTRIFFCTDFDLNGVCDTAEGGFGFTQLFQIEWGEAPCIKGTGGDDGLRGTRFDDCILAGGGDDTARGVRGDDVVKGGRGEDVLFGNAGDDELDGGAGFDVCWGGTGRDSFVRCEEVRG